MIVGLKPYPRMKDSGVPALGDVPAHWEVSPLGRLGRITKGRGGSKEDAAAEGVPCIRYGDLYTRHEFFIETPGSFVGPDQAHVYTPLRYGDLLFAGSGETMNDIGKSAVNLLTEAVCGGDVLIFRLLVELVPRFLGYVAGSRPAVEQKARMGRGFTVVHIYGDELKGLQLPVPPPSEQEAIVRFLEHADRRIRRYIGAKQKLIKLLEEQKQAIIHRAVTRGLDPNVRLKSSGIDWLGDIPERWEVKRLRSLVARVTSGSRGWSNLAADSGPLFIRVGNLMRSSIDLDLRNAVRLQLPDHVRGEAARTQVSPGDILLSITAYIGSVGVVPADIGEAYVSQHVGCCRLLTGVANHRWVAYVLLSPVGQTHGQLSMYGGTKQGLSLDDVKDYVVLLPPRTEQDSVVEWIETKLADVNRGINTALQEVALLREFRTQLIADVVTGKLDAREAAAGLSDECDDAESVDEADVFNEVEESALECRDMLEGVEA